LLTCKSIPSSHHNGTDYGKTERAAKTGREISHHPSQRSKVKKFPPEEKAQGLQVW